MNVFVAASYSSKVDYETERVFEEYKTWMEGVLEDIESAGHAAFSALRDDGYQINNADPAEAFKLDASKLEWCDTLLAFVSEDVSAGVQTEIGYALGLGKKVILVQEGKPAWFNAAMQKAGVLEIVDEFTPKTLSFE